MTTRWSPTEARRVDQVGVVTICTAVTIWPEIRPHGARLACCLPAGHQGEHACADIEYIEEGASARSTARHAAPRTCRSLTSAAASASTPTARPDDATRIVRQVLDLGWRPVVGSDPRRLWSRDADARINPQPDLFGGVA